MAGHMASQSHAHARDAHRNQASILVVILVITACKIIFVDGQQHKECVHGEADRHREEEDLHRRRLAQLHAETSKLIEVLKSLGAKGLSRVHSELERLEAEEEQVRQSLAEITKRQAPVTRVGDDAKTFLDTWQDIGELLESATPQEQMQILQHYIEVIELGAIDQSNKTGA